MSTYAIIKTGGKQVKVEVGQAIYVEKINAEAGSEVTFNEVVLVGGDKTVLRKVRAHVGVSLGHAVQKIAAVEDRSLTTT